MIEAEVGVGVGVEAQETWEGGEAAVLEAAMVAAEEVRWGEMEEAGAGVGVEAQETGEGGEAAALETTMVAAEEVRWGEVEVPLVVASVAVAGVTSASGRRTSKRFTPLGSRRRRTGRSSGSTLKQMTRLDYLFVRLYPILRERSFSPFRLQGPGWGTQGQPGIVRANFFTIRLPKDPIYDYTVKITPDPNKWVKERIFQLLMRHPRISPLARFIVHDKSERLVSARQLELPLEVTIDHADEGAPAASAKPYQVKLTPRDTLDPGQLTK